MSFDLTGEENIIIYGAGEQGKKIAELFYMNHFSIKAILDQGAASLNSIVVKNCAIPVVLPETYVINSKDEIVIVSLWNAVQHEKIAENLHLIGFDRIIYIPMAITGNKKLMSKMRNVFNDILEERLFLNNIPEYLDIVEKEEPDIMDENLIYMPIELLFSEEDFEIPLEQLTDSAYRKRKNVIKTSGENIANMQTYLQLYRYLDKSVGDCTDYLRTQISDYDKQNVEEQKKVLKDRYILFQIYEKAFEINREFFIDSAPRVKWNKKGYFNIVDGHHRVTYLFYKGIWDIPVRICEADKAYLEMLKKIPDTFFSESIHLINAETALFWRKKNAIICNSLRKKDVSGRSVFTNLSDAGYIARYCCRVGCRQCIDIETEEKYAFAKRMCAMFQYSDSLEICKDIVGNIAIDIAIMDEECISDFKDICASQYIIKLENHGKFYDRLIEKGMEYSRLGTAFDGEKEYLFIQMEGDSICFL